MDDICLTAKEVKEMDELGFDKRVTKDALRLATQFYQNSMNEIYKKEKEFWDNLVESRGLDRSKDWEIKKTYPFVKIVEKNKQHSSI